MRFHATRNRILSVFLAVCLLLSLWPVTASAAAGDPPVLQSAYVLPDGNVQLVFDKEMASPGSGAAGFIVADDMGGNKNVTSATLVSGDTTSILLTLGTTLKGGEAARVIYTPGTVKASDGGLLAAISSFDITNSLPHPTLTAATLTEGTAGSPYTYTFAATGGTGPYKFYLQFGPLPAGLSLGQSTGQLSGTPSTPGTYSFILNVYDANMAFDRETYTLKINPPAPSAGPTIAGAVMDAKNRYITVNFSEGVYGDAAHTTGVDENDFEINFAQHSGKVSGATIRRVEVVGGSPTGGETGAIIQLKLIDGPANGTETITISPKAGSIFNAAGIAAANTESTGPKNLNLLPAQSFAEGYPKVGPPQAVGSKTVVVLAKVVLEGVLSYVALPNNATPPTAQQIKDHADIDGQPVLTWAGQMIGDNIELPITLSSNLDHNTDYDIYLVAEAGNNNFSAVEKLDIRTPPETITVISLADIAGVTAPATGGTPVTTITETEQYTGTVSWSPSVSGSFDVATEYTATITLTPKPGYILTGVAENFFKVAGATAVSNPTDSGVITAVFPETTPTPGGPSGTAAWHTRAPLPSSHIIENIQYVNGKYIAVGEKGTLLTSDDGASWTKTNLKTNFDRLGGVAYGGGRYVLVGYVDYITANIYTSIDAVTWSEPVSIPHLWLHDVAYGAGKFVAVGSDQKVLTSTDGVSWTTYAVTYPIGQETIMQSIVYSDIKGKFVAVGTRSNTGQNFRGKILTSVDGITWTVTYSDPSYSLWDVTYGNGSFVAVGGRSDTINDSNPYFLATSGDGETWTRPVTSPSYATLRSVEFDGNRFIAAGSTLPSSSGTAFTVTSTNAVSWTDKTHGGLSGFYAAASQDTRIVATNNYGNIYTSDDEGTSWSYRTLGTTKTLKDVAYGSSLYVAVGDAGTIQSSPDGQTWTIQASGTMENLNKVDYLGGQFIAVGKNGTLLTSPNGTNWTPRASGTTLELKGIAYGSGWYVVVGGNIKNGTTPVVLYSTDGVTWTSVTTGFIGCPFVSVAYGEGVFLAAMSPGQAYKFQKDTDSGDEFVITRVTDLGSSGCYPTDIVYAGGRFAAVGGYGEVYLSSDQGVNWTILKTDLDQYYCWGITNGGGNLVAVGENGKIMASADGGVTWFIQPSGLTLNHYTSNNYIRLFGVAAGNNCFVAVGENGLILQSDSFTVSLDADINDVELAERSLYKTHIYGSGSNQSDSQIVADMNLMTSLNRGTTVAWVSSKPQVISADGKVTRPAFGAGDQGVYLTATITKGTASATRSFIVVVSEAENPDIADVSAAAAALTFDTIKAGNSATNNITSNLTLPDIGANGTAINWASSQPTTISADGTVTLPAEGSADVSVTLTATISKGEASQTKTFYLVVKAASPSYSITVNSGTADKSTATAGTVVTITANPPKPGECFEGWTYSPINLSFVSGTGVKDATAHFIMPAQVVMLTATYEPLPVDTFSITVQTDGNGMANAKVNSNNVTSATAGTEITVTATPNSGYRFKEWQVVSGGVSIIENKFTMPAADITIKAIFEQIPANSYTVTVNGSHAGTTGAGSYVQGATVTVHAGSRSGYSFAGWTSSDIVAFANANSTTTTFTMPAKNVTVTATWSYNGGSSDDDDSSDEPTVTPLPLPKAEVLDSEGNSTSTVPVLLDKNTGLATVEVNSSLLTGAFDQSEIDERGIKRIEIEIPEISGAKSYALVLPASALNAGGESKTIELNTPLWTVTLPGNMLEQATGAQSVTQTIKSGDISGLDPDVQALIGNRPMIELSLEVDGQQFSWSNEKSPVTVTLPYTPTAEELANPESIVVWYVDGKGNAVCIPNGCYNTETGTVTFTTTHFSSFAVGYNPVSFKDISANSWYAKAVSFISARNITSGTGNGNFSPELVLTRGQFIVMLMRAYSIAPDTNPDNNFADANNLWYAGYLSAAKRLGITAGTGNNMFGPEREITRQEMFTLLYNALKAINSLPGGNSGKSLSDFTDAAEIAPWAKEAMKLLVETDTITGSGGRLNPAGTTTRAQIAQVLYNLLSKQN